MIATSGQSQSVFQIQARIPFQSPTGDIRVLVTAQGFPSQPGITIGVQSRCLLSKSGHAALTRRIGVKPQQVQRYEATEYGSASFARILKVVQALGLIMPRAVRLVRNP